MDRLITVIVPVYNIEEYLERCVRSIMDQTYQNLEIILVDDGSTDSSGVICDRLAEEDDRIRVFHKKNGGSSSARNLGIREAKGEYIGFIDSDDYIEPDMYELLADAIFRGNGKNQIDITDSVSGNDINAQGQELKQPILMAQISRDEIDEQGNRMPNVCEPPKEERQISSQEMMRELLMHRGDCSYCTRLTHRSLFENMSFPEGKLNEDFYLLIQMLCKINRLVILPKQCYHVFYRVGSNNRKKDKNDFSRVFSDIVENADVAMELVKNKYPELVPAAFRFGCFQRLDYLLHIPIGQMTKENDFYQNIVTYLRKNVWKMLTNTYLTKKNKIYLLLLTIAPKTVRKGHAGLKGL